MITGFAVAYILPTDGITQQLLLWMAEMHKKIAFIKSMVLVVVFFNHSTVFASVPTDAPRDIQANTPLAVGTVESFEDVPANWIVETDVNGAGAAVSSTSAQKHSGSLSAAVDAYLARTILSTRSRLLGCPTEWPAIFQTG